MSSTIPRGYVSAGVLGIESACMTMELLHYQQQLQRGCYEHLYGSCMTAARPAFTRFLRTALLAAVVGGRQQHDWEKRVSNELRQMQLGVAGNVPGGNVYTGAGATPAAAVVAMVAVENAMTSGMGLLSCGDACAAAVLWDQQGGQKEKGELPAAMPENGLMEFWRQGPVRARTHVCVCMCVVFAFALVAGAGAFVCFCVWLYVPAAVILVAASHRLYHVFPSAVAHPHSLLLIDSHASMVSMWQH